MRAAPVSSKNLGENLSVSRRGQSRKVNQTEQVTQNGANVLLSANLPKRGRQLCFQRIHMKSSVEKMGGRDEAFTRMDLALAVAGIAVLLLVALSAQARPRNRVYQVTDVSNHRRLMQAMTAFAADNADTLPNCGWGTTWPSWAYGANLPATGGTTFSGYKAAHSLQLTSLTNGQLFPYLQDPRVFMCPADRPDNAVYFARSIFITSYVWNGAVNAYSDARAGSAYKLSQFRPDAVLQWEVDERTPFFFNDSSCFPDEGISERHGTNIYFGMFGGGVGATKAQNWFGNEFAGPSGPFGRGSGIPASLLPNRAWCNPGKANGLP